MRSWLVAAVLSVLALLLWQWQRQPKAPSGPFDGWSVLEAKVPPGFDSKAVPGLTALVELQLLAKGLPGVVEVKGAVVDNLPLPERFNIPGVDDQDLRGAMPLVLRREEGRWDDRAHLPRLAYLLQALQKRSSRYLAVSLFPSHRPLPEALAKVMPKAQIFLLSGPREAMELTQTVAAFDHLRGRGVRILDGQSSPANSAEAAAILSLSALGQGAASRPLAIEPMGMDVEAQLKARLPGGLRVQAIGLPGMIYHDEAWISGPGAELLGSERYREQVAGLLSPDGREVLILLAHESGRTLPSLQGLTPEPGLSLLPLGGAGQIGLSPFSVRLAALQMDRALPGPADRETFIASDRVRVYLKMAPGAPIPSLSGLSHPGGLRLRLQSPPQGD